MSKSKEASKASETYTVEQIAERWHCSRSTVLTHIYDGTLAAIDVSTNPRKRSRYVVPLEALQAFEQARTVPPPERPEPRRKRISLPAGVIEFFPEG